MNKIIFILCIFFSISIFSQGKNVDSVGVVLEKQLQEVEIKTKKKLVERKIDRLVFNVESSSSAAGDAIDALRVTPGVKVINEKISVIGKGKVSLMVDDKFIQLSGGNLANFLKAISSDNIKSIEVITTPPAKWMC